MTLIVVSKGIVSSGYPKEQNQGVRPTQASAPQEQIIQNPVTQQQLTQVSQRAAATAGSVGSEAVITSIRNASKSSTSQAEKLETYEEAKDLSDDVADEIRVKDDEEPIDAHRGMSGKGGYYA